MKPRKPSQRWYAAHLVEYAKALEGEQERWPVWENVVLISAESFDEVFEKARKIGEEMYGGGGEWIFEGQRVDWVFGGVRKVMECQDLFPRRPSHPSKIRSGVEATYYQFIIESEEDLRNFLEDKPVRLVCEQNPIDEEP